MSLWASYNPPGSSKSTKSLFSSLNTVIISSIAVLILHLFVVDFFFSSQQSFLSIFTKLRANIKSLYIEISDNSWVKLKCDLPFHNSRKTLHRSYCFKNDRLQDDYGNVYFKASEHTKILWLQLDPVLSHRNSCIRISPTVFDWATYKLCWNPLTATLEPTSLWNTSTIKNDF